MLLFDIRVRPTEAEWLDGLKRSGLRRAGTGRLIVQTVLMVFIAVMAFLSFFIDGMNEPMSAGIGTAAAAIIPVMWIVPHRRMLSMARIAAEEGSSPHLWVFEEGFDFGEQVTGAYYAFGDVHWACPEEGTLDTLVLRTKTDDVIVIPHRELTDAQWDRLINAVKGER